MVYEHSLCVDGVLAPCNENFRVNGDHEGPPPKVALLATNRQIRHEALPVLFGKNTWRITSGTRRIHFRDWCEGGSYPEHKRGLETELSRRGGATLLRWHGPLIRKVVLNYNFQDIRDRTDDVTDIHDSVETMTSRERMQRLHDRSWYCSIMCWTEKQYLLWWMHGVTSIVIDISHLYCYFGCCRFDMMEDLFGNQFLLDTMANMVKKWNMKLPSFEVKGTRNKEEDTVIEEWLQDLKEPAFSERLAEVDETDDMEEDSGEEETSVKKEENHEASQPKNVQSKR